MKITNRFATEDYVAMSVEENEKKFIKTINGITPDDSGNVDLAEYATEQWVQEGYQPKGNYLTEHQSLEGLATETYVNTQISEIPIPDVPGQINTHNTATNSHNDIRLLITGLTTRLNTLANSDDATLDQMSEIVTYIKSNKSLIDGITTNKVNVSDIINNLTTSVSNKPLSAAQGVALKALIDDIVVPTKVSELTNDKNYLTSYTETDPTVPSWAKAATKPTYTADEVGALPDDTEIPVVPTNVSAFTNDVGYLTEHQSLDGFATEGYVNTIHSELSSKITKVEDEIEQIKAYSIGYNEETGELTIISSQLIYDETNGNLKI